MRVISGKYRGIKLKGPEKSDTRPTSDRVKEALFSILTNDIEDSVFLDLFAGTGCIGIEALSRNASNVVFIDFDRNALKIINENLKKAKCDPSSFEVFHANAWQAIDRLSSRKKVFSIIFMDPPYAMENTEQIIEKIFDREIIANYGKIIVEHDKRDELPDNIRGLKKSSDKKYGNTVLTIYEMGE